MKDRPPTQFKSDPGDLEMDARYGFGIILPFAVLSAVIWLFKILFFFVKPKSTLVRDRERKGAK